MTTSVTVNLPTNNKYSLNYFYTFSYRSPVFFVLKLILFETFFVLKLRDVDIIILLFLCFESQTML